MSKDKTAEVTEAQVQHIRHMLVEAEDQCRVKHEEGQKDYMQPMIIAIKDAQDYLKTNVEAFGLYQYSQKAMYGKGTERSEEASIACGIYLDVHRDESLPTILGDTTDE